MPTITTQLKRAAVPAAAALVLSAAGLLTSARAARVIVSPEQVYSGSNFSMLSGAPPGTTAGGTNDVTSFWDGTVYNSQSDIPVDMTTGTPNALIRSPTPFFGVSWFASTVMVFAPGTYTFVEDKKTNTVTWDAGGAMQTMTVGAGQLGVHMLFAWNGSFNIGVVNVWDKNALFAPSPMETGPKKVSTDPWSGNAATSWTLMSSDVNGSGVNGQGMVNGPFTGFDANFNLFAVNTGPTATDDTCAVAPVIPTPCDVITNDVAQTGFAVDPATVVIESAPSRGTAVANANGTVTYTSAAGVTAGTDRFTYTVRDNNTAAGLDEVTFAPSGKGLRSNLATVTINIGMPSAGADSAQTPQGTKVAVDVLANDSAPPGATLNPAAVTVTTAPTVGTTSVNAANGNIVYTPPDASFTGLVTFQYTVADNTARVSLPTTVTIQVQGTGLGSNAGTVNSGILAAGQGISSGMMTTNQLAAAGVPMDPAVVTECVGGCFDFNLSGITGATAGVVFKLSAPIPTNPGYRKWNGNKWVDFFATAPNALLSAPLAPSGNCPAAGVVAYTAGLQPGNRCVELIIQDNSPNDQDAATGTITDPGGVAQLLAVGAATLAPSGSGGGSGGCSISPAPVSAWRGGAWWLVGIVIGWLGLSRRQQAWRNGPNPGGH